MELAQLAVFLRPPVAGVVKTRLEPLLGARGAASLYAAFVEDTVMLCERVREAGRVDVALWVDGPPDDRVRGWAERLGTEPCAQPEGDLGIKLSVALDHGLREYERVVVIGTDIPTLPFGLIVAAFDALEDAPMVLGPACDGGYYAIGATHRARPRFEGVRWSTPSALEDTLRANAKLRVAMLPPWYDIDEPEDLQTLRAHLSVSPDLAPATARCLRDLIPAHR